MAKTNYDKVKPKKQKIKSEEVLDPSTVRLKKHAVVKGTIAKPSLISRAGHLFFGDDGFKGMATYLVRDVFIPSLQNTAADLANTAIQRAIFGEDYIHRRRGRNYSDYYGSGRSYYNAGRLAASHSRDTNYDQQYHRRNTDTSSTVSRIIFETSADAQEVFNVMLDNVEQYGMVSVADFYELSDVQSKFTDHQYGWTDLRSTRIVAARGGGYIIEFPPVEQI